MTLLRSKEGKFFDLPEDSLKQYEVPAARVKELLAELDSGAGSEGDVEPYGYYGGDRYAGNWYSPYYPDFFPRRRRRHRYYDYY